MEQLAVLQKALHEANYKASSLMVLGELEVQLEAENGHMVGTFVFSDDGSVMFRGGVPA